MKNSFSESYKSAGVDITAGYASVQLMKEHIARTKTEGCISDIGGFGGLFSLGSKQIDEPILVSGTDGVGTKLRIAELLDKHDTIGIDCVAMCVNDVICCGAKPLFFLDYIACGKNEPKKIASIVSGVAEGCVRAGAALIGGETAEHPGMMANDDYDLAGFTVGLVDKKNMFKSEHIKAGDKVLALRSSGIHSNGFSLVRKVFDVENADLGAYSDELGTTLGEALLTPTKIYVKPVLALAEKIEIKAASHITGGGFYENLPRILPAGFSVEIQKDTLDILPIFRLLQAVGDISEHDMFNTFNMGVGMALVVAAEDAKTALEVLRQNGEDAYCMGEIVEGANEVLFV